MRRAGIISGSAIGIQEEKKMRKKIQRLLAGMLALAAVVCMAGCAAGAPAETLPTEGKDPEAKVRLYYPTEILTEVSCLRYDYEENWWEKESFSVEEYQIREGEYREVLRKSLYIDGIKVTDNKEYPEPGEYGMSYYQWTTEYSCYENGKKVYCRVDMEEDNHFGHICDLYSWEYDEEGRLVKHEFRELYKEGHGMEDSGDILKEYEYVDTDSGSVGTWKGEDGHREKVYYDTEGRMIRQEWYSKKNMYYYCTYEYNSAGCLVKVTCHDQETGETRWEKYLFDTVEVTLAVAEQYPMFLWEYID